MRLHVLLKAVNLCENELNWTIFGNLAWGYISLGVNDCLRVTVMFSGGSKLFVVVFRLCLMLFGGSQIRLVSL